MYNKAIMLAQQAGLDKFHIASFVLKIAQKKQCEICRIWQALKSYREWRKAFEN